MKCPVMKPNDIYEGDSLDLLKCMDDESVDLVMTSPPYADKRKKSYGGVKADEYNEWFHPIAKEIKRVLKPSGSFVLNINDVIDKGVRHPYVYNLVTELAEDGWRWVDSFIWFKPNPIPRVVHYRFKDGFEYIYHFTKQKDFKRDMKAVKIPMSKSTLKGIESAKKRDDYHERTFRPSGMNWKTSNLEKLDGMAYPSNVIKAAVSPNKTVHTAVFPKKIPDFFISFLTEPGDVVLDPFSGSGTTSVVAKEKCRQFIGLDRKGEYVDISRERLEGIDDSHCKVD